MDSIHSEYIRADKVLSEYGNGNHKFLNRFETQLVEMNQFIEVAGLKGKAAVNEMVLGYALLDYFEDIRRLKEFHKVEHVNSIRIVSYMSFWLLKRKPIQILVNDKDAIYINEKYVLAYILDFLSTSDYILDRQEVGLRSFKESLYYFLKYRLTSPNSLELALTSFFAGQIYQDINEDLSNKLERYCD